MDFSLMFWGHTEQGTDPADKYRLLLEAGRYADAQGFAALWVPERHFHPWGGLYPNPAVLLAALATVTTRIRLRAGSVVVPLHHPLRIAEEWSVVDNLSGGRVELAMASGWKDDDFALAPERYAKRKSDMVKSMDTVQQLWRGNTVQSINGSGQLVDLRVHPRPIQPELPLWVTSAGSLKTITHAGAKGCGLLTHLLGQNYAELEQKIAQYHAYRRTAGFTGPGKISLMLHTFLGNDRNQVRELVREPLSAYLLESAELSIPIVAKDQWQAADASLKQQITAQAFERYFDTAALMGTVEDCRKQVFKLAAMGITDICCLVDFGLPVDTVLAGLKHLAQLKDACAGR